MGWLTQAVLNLPPVEQRIIELIYYGHHSQQQAADILGMPVRALSAQLMDAMRAIAQIVETPLAKLTLIT